MGRILDAAFAITPIKESIKGKDALGIGDNIMATAQVKAMNEANGLPVVVMGLEQRRLMWSEVFEHNPRILRRPSGRFQILVNGPNARPYIAAKYQERWVWKKWNIQPGELYFDKTEREFAEPYRGCVLIEPHTKVANGNKAWEWQRWQMLVEEMADIRFVQTGPFNTRPLRGVELVATSFRQAAAILSVARAFVGSEGALHHAAAALSIPAVVLWSEFISPEITGYSQHRNIRHAGTPCGARVPCVGCKISMGLISVEEVMAELKEALQ
jgi:hypothetical protein